MPAADQLDDAPLMVVAGFVDDRSEWILFILGGSILTCCVW
eukprot:COSAG04_NODE_16426_length_499_cov_1.170000_1_plen_40_part_10